jgi:hypothetical protein
MTSFLNIIEQGPESNRVTKRFLVQSKAGVQLGEISWYCGWRRYCFYPNPFTVLDAACLREIANAMQVEMELRRLEKEAHV